MNRNDTPDDATDISSTVEWLSDTQIKLQTAPAYGYTLTITRVTPSDKVLVTFRDGSTPTAANLNLLGTQLLHVVEEGRDFTGLVHNLVKNAGGILETYKSLSIAVDDLPYGQMASSSWDAVTAMLTLFIPQGRPGIQGPPGVGERGPQGEQGPPGPPGEAPIVDVIDCGGAHNPGEITVIDGGNAFSFTK